MEAATITNLDDERLIREGEVAAAEYGRHVKRAQDQIIPMARGLLAARRKYPATREFGVWFDASSYAEIVTHHNMRAALIKIGEHEACARTIMGLTKSVSPIRIWDGIKEVLALPIYQISKSLLQSQETPEVDISPEITADSEAAVSGKRPEDEEIVRVTPPPLNPRHGFYGMKRGDELAAVFTGPKTRQTIAAAIKEPGGTKIWNLILRAYDGGLIPASQNSFNKPSLALLCPALPQRFVHKFDLTKPADRSRAEELLPRLIALKEKILESPQDIETILAEATQCEKAEAQQLRSEVAVATLPASERQIIMFGRTVWPRQDSRQGEYSYRQICAAVWSFNDFDRWSRLNPDNSVVSRAMRVRLTFKWLIELSMLEEAHESRMRPVFSLVQWLSRLLEEAPEAPCKIPPYPSNEGRW